MRFKTWLESFNLPLPRKEAVRQGFLFHGMSESGFKELLGSAGFEGGGFADEPVKAYGPRFIAIRTQDMPEPSWHQGKSEGRAWNVQFSFTKPHKNLIPLRSEEEARKWGPAFALPLKFVYEADADGNVIRPLQ